MYSEGRDHLRSECPSGVLRASLAPWASLWSARYGYITIIYCFDVWKIGLFGISVTVIVYIYNRVEIRHLPVV